MKKQETAAYIFLCSEVTQGECFERNLFGGGEKYEARVRGVKKGDKLFLYNYNTKKLHGLFEATSELKRNIVPFAWKVDTARDYPWQIRVRRIEECEPLSREDIGNTLKFDVFSRPSARLSLETVETLEKLFKAKKRVKIYRDDIQYLTDDGHRVRSKAELQIDNWLYKNHIAHGYETAIPGAKRCDFEVPTKSGKVYIEYWGLEDKNYIKNMEQKLGIYKTHKLKLISVYPKDLKNLDQKLKASGL